MKVQLAYSLVAYAHPKPPVGRFVDGTRYVLVWKKIPVGIVPIIHSDAFPVNAIEPLQIGTYPNSVLPIPIQAKTKGRITQCTGKSPFCFARMRIVPHQTVQTCSDQYRPVFVFQQATHHFIRHQRFLFHSLNQTELIHARIVIAQSLPQCTDPYAVVVIGQYTLNVISQHISIVQQQAGHRLYPMRFPVYPAQSRPRRADPHIPSRIHIHTSKEVGHPVDGQQFFPLLLLTHIHTNRLVVHQPDVAFSIRLNLQPVGSIRYFPDKRTVFINKPL